MVHCFQETSQRPVHDLESKELGKFLFLSYTTRNNATRAESSLERGDNDRNKTHTPRSG
jgi:hypothetical protein